jgi:hypothetical protein
VAVAVLALVLSSMIAAAPAAAQNAGRLTGRVIDSLTLQPIAGAVVTVAELKRDALSGEDRRYAFDGLPPGTGHLTARIDGTTRPMRRTGIICRS